MQQQFAQLMGNETWNTGNNEGSKFYKVNEDLKMLAENTTFMGCPTCKKGHLKIKATRNDTLFIACTNFPSCKQTMSLPNKAIKNVQLLE